MRSKQRITGTPTEPAPGGGTPAGPAAPEVAELQRRLGVLETGLRRWRAVSLGTLGALMVAALLGASGVTREVRTRSLIIMDEDGHSRAAFKVNQDGGIVLGLTDKDRKTRLALFVHPDGGSGLSLADASHKPRVRLELSPASPSRSGLILQDAAERARAEVVVQADGSPEIDLWSADGKNLFQAPPEAKPAGGS